MKKKKKKKRTSFFNITLFNSFNEIMCLGWKISAFSPLAAHFIIRPNSGYQAA